MPAIAAILYLLLALRVRISLSVSLCGAGGSIAFAAGAAGISLRFDAAIEKGGLLFSVTPRYGKKASSGHAGEKHEKPIRRVKACFWLARMGRMERLALHARVGFKDAAQTAIAAGCLHAAAASLFSTLDSEAVHEMRIVPDFDAAGFCAQLHCIFSCQAGDIMLAAIRAAVEKSRREGLGWKSIPLRA